MNARNPAFDDVISLAKSGQMSIDQLFQAAESLQANQNNAAAIELYKSWATHGTAAHRHLALFNLGSLLQHTGDRDAAAVAYQTAIALNPNLAQAHINLGLLYEKQGLHEQAIAQWGQVLAHALSAQGIPKDMQVVALNHIGRVHEDRKRYDLAEQALEQSLYLDPKQPGVIQHWVHIRQKSCKWPVYKDLPHIRRHDLLMATSPLAMLALTDDPVQQLLTAHAFVERTYSFKQDHLFKQTGKRYQHARIRIGYVSGDLCVHAVGLLLAELLESHDRTRFEIYGYDFSPEDGTPHRQRLKQAFDHLRSVHTLSDREVAGLVLHDEIDVLIDLHGLSAGARPGIFALHPAPLQGTYLGFIGTTGMPWFDFVIADRYVLPEALATYFTEQPLYVEGCFIPLSKPTEDIPKLNRSTFGFSDQDFVIAAFGNVYKVTEQISNVWQAALEQCPHAKLWLIDDNPTTTRQLTERFSKLGPDRLVFTKRSSHLEYLGKIAVADLFLDNYPYNCGSTAKDVISVGVPLITLSGKTMVSRMGGSILRYLNASALIAHDVDSYLNLIVDAYHNRDKLKQSVAEMARMIENRSNAKQISMSIERFILDKQLRS